MKPPQDSATFVERAQQTGNYKLKLTFSDSIERVVDFGAFLHSSSNPLIREYLDAQRFAQYTIKDGDLIWGDYDLCFPIADLYEGRV